MQYYIVKSGREMYDLSRAYGLGLILQKLSGSKIKVKDLGHYYFIEMQAKPNLKKLKGLAGLLPQESDKKWRYVFLTLKGKINEIKNCKELIVNRKLISLILDKFKEIEQPEFFDSKKGNKTLYQSLDLSATKGIREKIRGRKYDEGSQLYVSQEDFLLSAIGHLNFTIWKWKGTEQIIMILFNPSIEGVPIGISPDARDITKRIDESLKVHRTGILSTLCYTALSLAKETSRMKERIVKFSNLIFGVMVSSGQQKKPYGGGIYPLDFLYEMIKSTEKSGEIIDQWIDIFRLTNIRPGYEDLALYLSEFITYPSEETLDRYLRTHLRIFLSKGVKPKLKPKLYHSDVMLEVLKNVGKTI